MHALEAVERVLTAPVQMYSFRLWPGVWQSVQRGEWWRSNRKAYSCSNVAGFQAEVPLQGVHSAAPAEAAAWMASFGRPPSWQAAQALATSVGRRAWTKRREPAYVPCPEWQRSHPSRITS